MSGSASEHVEPLAALRKSCERIATIPAANTQEMAALLSKMGLDYFQDVRRQAQQSFLSALAAATIGILFFFYATYRSMEPSTSSDKISLIAGALVQVIAAINFYLYGRTSRQFALFHHCLDRFNRFMLANSMCENIQDTEKRDRFRADLAAIVANAPPLTADLASPRPRRRATRSRKKS
jgi:hypothetical protein